MFMQNDAETPPAEGSTDAGNEALNQAQNAVSGITDGDVTTADLWALWDAIGWPMVQGILLILGVLIISSWVRRMVTGASRKAKLDETLSKFFGNMARWGVMLLGGLAILGTFGVEMTSFAAVIAAMGFAIGMALSGTLGNFAAGVMLLVFRPFKVGDVVSAAGVTAKVDEIGMFATTMDTPDNRRFIVPNGKLFGDTIENITYHKTRRVDVNVGTEYPADLDKVREVLMSVARSVEGGSGDPEPVVYLKELGGSSIDWAVRVWAKTEDYWAVRERLTRNIKVALDDANIGIPFPQMDVHLDRLGE